MSDQWSTGLYGCCSDCETCYISFCVPVVALGQQNKIINGGGEKLRNPMFPIRHTTRAPSTFATTRALAHPPTPRDPRDTEFFSLSCCLSGYCPSLISGCCCIGPNQTALKAKLGITQSDCLGDNCCAVCCQSCVLARMGRELKARGIYTMEQLSGQLPATLAPSNMTMISTK